MKSKWRSIVQRNTQLVSGGCEQMQKVEAADRKVEKIKTLHFPSCREKKGCLYLPLPQVPKLTSSGNTAALLGQWKELGHRRIQIVNSFVCLFYIQHMPVTEVFAIYILLLLCAFLWRCLPPMIRGHIPGLAISDVGAKSGSEGLKWSDCSPGTTRLFSAARHFQTVPHFSELISLTGCICLCQHVHRGTDIILDRVRVRM